VVNSPETLGAEAVERSIRDLRTQYPKIEHVNLAEGVKTNLSGLDGDTLVNLGIPAENIDRYNEELEAYFIAYETQLHSLQASATCEVARRA
jgi:hypothetical protein